MDVTILSVESERVLVSWGDCPEPNGNITSYIISAQVGMRTVDHGIELRDVRKPGFLQENAGDGHLVEVQVAGEVNQTWVSGLHGFTNYSLTAFAATSAGWSPPSTPLKFFTDIRGR